MDSNVRLVISQLTGSKKSYSTQKLLIPSVVCKIKIATVTTIFWARVLCSLVAEDACFRIRITLGVVLIRSWFSTFVFRNVPGTVSECVRICWFERHSSNLVRAPKMRDSVLLNFWDSFRVTLPSICSETCVIYSSLIPGTDVFRDWPFLGFSSCVSLVTAANFSFVSQRCHLLDGKKATQL